MGVFLPQEILKSGTRPAILSYRHFSFTPHSLQQSLTEYLGEHSEGGPAYLSAKISGDVQTSAYLAPPSYRLPPTTLARLSEFLV